LTPGRTAVGTRTLSSRGTTAEPVGVSPEQEPGEERTIPRERSVTRGVELPEEDEPPVEASGMQSPPTFELLLASAGYLPIRKILTREDGETMLRYIKAVNADNNTVYVIPDVEGVSVVREGEEAFEMRDDGQEIPHSVKTGALRCADGLCSVLIECGKNQVCTVDSDTTSQTPVETTMAVASDDPSDGNDVYPYPIVRLSDILRNRKAVDRSVEKTTKRFRSLVNEMSRDGLDKLVREVYGVENAVSEFVPAYRKAIKDLSESSALIAKLRIQHDMAQTRTPEDEQKLATLGYNVTVRSEMLSDLLSLGSEMEELAVKMQEVRTTIEQRTRHVKESYAALDKVYTQD